jgi:CheY-like chemotaxis protein
MAVPVQRLVFNVLGAYTVILARSGVSPNVYWNVILESAVGLAGSRSSPPMLDHIAGTTPRRAKYANLRGKRILVVEDEAIIAVDYYFQLRAVGAQPQAYTTTIKASLDYLAAHDDVDAAIVNIALRDGPCELVLDLLVARRIPFIVVSGYSDAMPSGLVASGLALSKPVWPDEVWCALSEALRVAATEATLH